MVHHYHFPILFALLALQNVYTMPYQHTAYSTSPCMYYSPNSVYGQRMQCGYEAVAFSRARCFSVRRKVISHRFALDNHASFRTQIATHKSVFMNIMAQRKATVARFQGLTRAFMSVVSCMPQLMQGKEKQSMTRMSDEVWDDAPTFQAGGRASNRRVRYFTTIRSRCPHEPRKNIGLGEEGFLSKREARLILRARMEEITRVEKERKDALREKMDGNLQSSPSPPQELAKPDTSASSPVVCLLDLDMTCFWGNDCNDLGCALQWMHRSQAVLIELYRILWNPQATATMNAIRRGYDTRSVIYTRRPSLLRYRSCFRPKTIRLHFKEDWHQNEVVLIGNEATTLEQLILPSEVRTADDIIAYMSGSEPLLEREIADIRLCFTRLLAARQITQEKLGLSEPPQVVVTCTPKDVCSTARRLGFPGGTPVFLWDDNDRLWDREGVFVVDRFDALTAEQRPLLEKFLSEHLPLAKLDSGLTDFLLSAPEDCRVLEKNLLGMLKYSLRTQDKTARQWTLPDLPGLKQQPSRGLRLFRSLSSAILRVRSTVTTNANGFVKRCNSNVGILARAVSFSSMQDAVNGPPAGVAA